MALPGLLIEYLISGAVALFWLVPITRNFGLEKLDSLYATLLVPGLYVVGMMIDFIAYVITRRIKHAIRAQAAKTYDFSPEHGRGTGTARAVKIGLYAPELAKEFAMRSSRDRIARDTTVNSILATIVTLPFLPGIALVLFSCALWAGFEHVSYCYEREAEHAIDRKFELGGDG